MKTRTRRDLRRPLAIAALPGSALAGVALLLGAPAQASNDSYCGEGVGHIAYHQSHTVRWRNSFLHHGTPYSDNTRYHTYIKEFQPSYYPARGLGWLWGDGGRLSQACHSTSHK